MSALRARLAALALGILFVPPAVAPAESPSTGFTLVPRDVYVGDTAELSFEVTLDRSALGADGTLEIDTSLLAPSRDVSVLSATVRALPGRCEVRVRFVPWVSGPLELPSLPVGSETVAPPVPVIASLILDPAAALEGPRSPILVPGTSWILYGFLACVLAVLFLSAFAVSRIRRYAAAGPSARNSARRKRAFLRDLSALSRRTGKLSQDDWYVLFSASLRRYLGLYAYGAVRPALSLTGRELADVTERVKADGAVPENTAAAARAGEIVRNLFDGADLVRFSGRACGERRSRDLALARELCAVLEEEGSRAVP